MSIGLFLQGICFVIVTVGLGIGTRNWQFAAVAFMFLYNTIFSMTCNATPWLYPAEVNTQVYRNVGAAVATASNWISNYAVVLVTPVGISNIAWKYYIIYAVLNFVFAPIVWFAYVETANLTLEEVDEVFERLYYEKHLESILPMTASKVSVVDHEPVEVMIVTGK